MNISGCMNIELQLWLHKINLQGMHVYLTEIKHFMTSSLTVVVCSFQIK